MGVALSPLELKLQTYLCIFNFSEGRPKTWCIPITIVQGYSYLSFFPKFSCSSFVQIYSSHFFMYNAPQWSAKMAIRHSKGKEFVRRLSNSRHFLAACSSCISRWRHAPHCRNSEAAEHSLSSVTTKCKWTIVWPTCLFPFIHIICVQLVHMLFVQLRRSAGCCGYCEDSQIVLAATVAQYSTIVLLPYLSAVFKHPERDTALKIVIS